MRACFERELLWHLTWAISGICTIYWRLIASAKTRTPNFKPCGWKLTTRRLRDFEGDPLVLSISIEFARSFHFPGQYGTENRKRTASKKGPEVYYANGIFKIRIQTQQKSASWRRLQASHRHKSATGLKIDGKGIVQQQPKTGKNKFHLAYSGAVTALRSFRLGQWPLLMLLVYTNLNVKILSRNSFPLPNARIGAHISTFATEMGKGSRG